MLPMAAEVGAVLEDNFWLEWWSQGRTLVESQDHSSFRMVRNDTVELAMADPVNHQKDV